MDIVYCPIGVPTFDLKVAGIQFDKSIKLLKSLDKNIIVPEKPLLAISDLNNYLDKINPSLIILQNLTFANSAYASEVIFAHKNCPILLWTLKEPVIDGTRLRLNSLTGAYSAANIMHNLKASNFEYIFGSPEDLNVAKKIKSCILAASIKEELKHTNIAAVGSTPQGFGFGRALDSEMASFFGVRLINIEARELMNKALNFKDEEAKEYLSDITCSCLKSESIDKKNLLNHSKLMRAYTEFTKENDIKILASRCWPDFFTEFGTPVCAVLSLLNDHGVSAACEADMYGALSMYIASYFTKKSCFFGDPVSLDIEENTITYWHCGMAAPSLSREPTLGLHPNRKMGPVMDFGLKQSDSATIFRIGRCVDATFRIFVSKAEILDKPKQFSGTSVVVKPKHNAQEIVNQSVLDGWEPHFVVSYGDISDEIKTFGKYMNIPVIEY
jgi:L-fucose isomerase-like protein